MQLSAVEPTRGAIAVWPTSGCRGTAAYHTYGIAAGATDSSCFDVSAVLPTYNFLSVRHGQHPSIGQWWSVWQYADAQACRDKSSGSFETNSGSGSTLDPGCYNFKGGSFAIYVQGQSGGDNPLTDSGATVTSSWPPMHPTQWDTSTAPVPTSSSQVVVATWKLDRNCLSGSQIGAQVTMDSCSMIKSGGSAGFAYSVSCASKTTTSSWTLTPYSSDDCAAGSSASAITGTGPTCVPIDLWNGSAFINCAAEATWPLGTPLKEA